MYWKLIFKTPRLAPIVDILTQIMSTSDLRTLTYIPQELTRQAPPCRPPPPCAASQGAKSPLTVRGDAVGKDAAVLPPPRKCQQVKTCF